MFTSECKCEQEFSRDNTFSKRCEQYCRSERDFGYINRKVYERDSD